MNKLMIMQHDEFKELHAKIDHLCRLAETNRSNTSNRVIANEQLIQELGISKRTAQNWRTKGLIDYFQIGRKIYYYQADVDAFLQNHRQSNFAAKRNNINNITNNKKNDEILRYRTQQA